MIFRYKQPTGPTLAEKLALSFSKVKRVLFVDDDEVLQEFMAHEVAPAFCADFLGVRSVAEARTAVEGSLPFDTALLDVKLTNGNGVELYREIAKKFPAMQVVFLTGYDSPELRQKIEAIGPARVYSKARVLDLTFLSQFFAQLGIHERQRAGVA